MRLDWLSDTGGRHRLGLSRSLGGTARREEVCDGSRARHAISREGLQANAFLPVITFSKDIFRYFTFFYGAALCW